MHLQHQVVARRVDRKEAPRRRHVGVERGLQRAVGQCILHHHRRHQAQPDAPAHRVDQQQAVVGAERAAHPHTCAPVRSVEHPFVAVVAQQVLQAVVARQVGGCRGPAVTFPVGGRGAHHAGQVHQRHGHQARVFQPRLAAQRDVDAFAHQIDRPVVQPHLEFDARVLRLERMQMHVQMRQRERHRCSHDQPPGQPAAHRADIGQRALGVCQRSLAEAVEALAGFGELHAARRSREQAAIGPGFQRLDGLRDDRVREVQRAGASGQAALLDDAAKVLHGSVAIHGAERTSRGGQRSTRERLSAAAGWRWGALVRRRHHAA
ncbi:hypothetical protein D9M68_536810 [compost metagenome]